MMVVGGVDVLVDALMVTGFAKLGALSERNDDPQAASRPFDADRDGFVLGEGAGVLILEERERALARGAEVLAELSGFGCSCNAYRITDSPPDGRGAYQSMAAALEDAGLGHVRMLLQVHDELVFELPESDVEQARPVIERVMAEAARPAVELTVPLGVEIGTGKSWGAAH